MKGSRHSRSFVGCLASASGGMEPLLNRRSLQLLIKAESLALAPSSEGIASRPGGHVAGVLSLATGREPQSFCLAGSGSIDSRRAGSGLPAKGMHGSRKAGPRAAPGR
jgi:hypothetical protein